MADQTPFFRQMRNCYVACRHGGKGFHGTSIWRAVKFTLRMAWGRVRYG